MTNEELAAHLNAELGLVGPDAVTTNVIRQWVGWDVLPRAGGRGRGRARGVNWERGDRDLRRASRLARWRADGVKREAAVVVHAFVEWGHPDWERVRDSLATELARSGASLRNRIRTDLDFQSFSQVSTARKKAFRTQLGPLDARLKGSGFELPAELYAQLGQAALRGTFDREKTLDITTGILTKLVSEQSDLIGSALPMLLSALPMLLSAQVGLFTDPAEAENTGALAILACSRDELRLARVILYSFRKIASGQFARPPENQAMTGLFEMLAALEPEIATGNWLIARLAVLLNLIVRKREERRLTLQQVNHQLLGR